MLHFDATDIHLDNTFGCGQTFRWRRLEDGSYAGNVQGRAVRAARDGRGLCLCGSGAQAGDEAFWRRYFDLDSDYAALLEPVMSPPLRDALDACPGIRLLNQPFFETLCSFILSANNNIRRITGIVDRFCAIAPEDENGLHAFPAPQDVLRAGRPWLDGIGAGYRAPYLWEAALRVDGGFDGGALAQMDYEDACRCIRQFPGVGEKVADCVLLFSCGHRAAFPVDTWVEKLLRQWYGLAGNRSQLKRQAMARFGGCGGVAQQYLFAYAMRCRL